MILRLRECIPYAYGSMAIRLLLRWPMKPQAFIL